MNKNNNNNNSIFSISSSSSSNSIAEESVLPETAIMLLLNDFLSVPSVILLSELQ